VEQIWGVGIACDPDHMHLTNIPRQLTDESLSCGLDLSSRSAAAIEGRHNSVNSENSKDPCVISPFPWNKSSWHFLCSFFKAHFSSSHFLMQPFLTTLTLPLPFSICSGIQKLSCFVESDCLKHFLSFF
jgi:hypothetical protein